MKKTAIFFFLIFFFTNNINAQSIIKGIVVDSIKLIPLKNVTIVVKENKESKSILKLFKSDDSGHYEIPIIFKKKFISFVLNGYEQKNFNDNTEENSLNNVDSVILNPQNYNTLETVEVKTIKKLISIDLDKIIYYTKDDSAIQKKTAKEAILNLPFFIINKGGNISYKNGEKIMLIINGTEYKSNEENLTDALQAIPANIIESISVLNDPPFKYKSLGYSLVVKIKAKGYFEGIIGNITSKNDYLGTKYNPSIQAFLLYKNKNLEIQSATYNKWEHIPIDYFSKESYTRAKSDETHMTIKQNAKNIIHSQDFTVNYLINKNNTIMGYLNLGQNRNNLVGNSVQENIDSKSEFYLSNITKSNRKEFGLVYDKMFKQKETGLNIELKRTQENPFKNAIQFNKLSSIMIESRDNQKNISTDFSINFHKDISKKIKSETFIRYSNRRYDDIFNIDSSNSALSKTMSSYKQQIYWIYQGFKFKTNDFLFNLGLNMDRSNYASNNDSIAYSFKSIIYNFRPEILIRKSLKKQNSSILYFKAKNMIYRPSSQMVGVYENIYYPNLVIVGNNRLTQYKDFNLLIGLEENILFKKNKRIFLYMELEHNWRPKNINEYISNDTVTNTTTLQYKDIGNNKSYNINIGASISMIKNIFANLFYSYSYNVLNNKIDNVSNKGSLQQMTIDVRYAGNIFDLQFMGRFLSSSPSFQGQQTYANDYRIILTKNCLQNKLAVSLNVDNFLNKHIITSSSYHQDNYSRYTKTINPGLGFGITLSYRFQTIKIGVVKQIDKISTEDIMSKSN